MTMMPRLMAWKRLSSVYGGLLYSHLKHAHVKPEKCRAFPPIMSKRAYYPLYNAGHFGNKAMTFESYADFHLWSRRNPDSDMTLTIRCTTQGGPCIYSIPKEDVLKELCRLTTKYPHYRYTLAETINPDENIVQGYLMEKDGEWYFDYSTVKAPMRTALEEETLHMQGRHHIKTMLKEVMDRPSWTNFKDLRRAYPGHVFELSVFGERVGTLNLNTIIWEVRKY